MTKPETRATLFLLLFYRTGSNNNCPFHHLLIFALKFCCNFKNKMLSSCDLGCKLIYWEFNKISLINKMGIRVPDSQLCRFQCPEINQNKEITNTQLVHDNQNLVFIKKCSKVHDAMFLFLCSLNRD